MKFAATALAAISFTLAVAMPAPVEEPQAYVPCTGLFGNAQCCATDVLGVADLNCHALPTIPTSPARFRDVCATAGERARCCVLPVAGQGVLCETPAGLGEQ